MGNDKNGKKDYMLKDEQDDEIIYDLNKTDPDLIKKKRSRAKASRKQKRLEP